MRRIIINIIIVILIGVMIYSGAKIVIWFYENSKTDKLLKKVSTSVHVDEGKSINDKERYSIDFDELRKINTDIKGWIKVEGTDVEMPVVQGNDNSFYLTHSLDKSSNSAGWAFIDYRNKLDGTDKNIIIYGHNRRDRSIFGTLKNIVKPEWYNNENNRYIQFITENETSIYEVFSVYQIEVEDYYTQTDFGKVNFLEFANKLKSRSVKNFNVDLTEDDNILTLSTCADNSQYRVVLHAVKIK